MKKSLLFTILSFLIFFLTSCELNFGIDIKFNKKSIDYSISLEDKEYIADVYDTCLLYVNQEDYDKFMDEYYKYVYCVNYVIENFKLARTSYHIDGNESAKNDYLSFYSLYNDLYKKYTELKVCVKNSSLKSKFFEGMTEEEIEEDCQIYPDNYYNLNNQILTLQTDYENLTDTLKKEQFSTYLVNLINYCNELAGILGYSNYLDYAYSEEYQRSYTYNDSITFMNYVKQYIVDYVLNLEISDLSDENKIVVDGIMKSNIVDNKKQLANYAKKIGGNYNTEYKHLINNGYLFKTTSSNGYDGAYTDYLYLRNEPMMLIGYGYDDPFTFIHEFGHYLAFANSQGESESYDVCETQSIGNEMLFTDYLINYGKYNDSVNDYLKKQTISKSLQYVIFSSVVNEFTIECFTKPDLVLEDIETINHDVIDRYGGYDNIVSKYPGLSNYCSRTVISQPGYYISYAVAYIASSELFSVLLYDFSKAKDIYLKLVSYDENIKGLDVLTNAGLNSPFSEEAFISIVS